MEVENGGAFTSNIVVRVFDQIGLDLDFVRRCQREILVRQAVLGWFCDLYMHGRQVRGVKRAF